jgi:hypothetical protein
MTWRLMAAFAFIFVFGTVISSIIDGNGGFVSTDLTAELVANETTASVNSTDGFFNSGYLYIEGEEIYYSGKAATTFTLTNKHRAHNIGQIVYTEASGTLNSLVGFDTKASSSTIGTIKTVVNLVSGLLHAIPKMILWDYSYLDNDVGIYIRMLGWILSAGLVISIIALLRGY